jgi:hypothetical protein
MASSRRRGLVHPIVAGPTPSDARAAFADGVDSPSISTPADEPIHKGRKRIPSRGNRAMVWPDGDHTLMAISDGTTAPKGSLLWIPGVPKFTKRLLLDRWLKRTDNKAKLLGHQIAQVKFTALHQPMEQARPSVTLNTKRKFMVEPASESEDE